MTLEEMHNASFETIKASFKWTHKWLSKCFVTQWRPYPGQTGYKSTERKKKALEIIFKTVAPWAYQLGYEQGRESMKKSKEDKAKISYDIAHYFHNKYDGENTSLLRDFIHKHI